MNKTRLHLGYFVGFSMLLGALILSLNNPVSKQEYTNTDTVLADVTCSSSATTAINAFNLSSDRIEIKFDSFGQTGISRVDFVFSKEAGINEVVIGKGVKESTNIWRMIWDTRYYEPIPAAMPGQFRATLHFTNNTSCKTIYSPIFSIPANVSPTVFEIDAFINPPNWSTFVNTNINVVADFPSLPPELHPYVIVNWQPQIGSVFPAYGKSTSYSSGSSSGNGKLRMNAIYSGKFIQREIDVVVYSSTSSSGGTSSGGTKVEDTTTTTTTFSGSEFTATDSDDKFVEPLPEIKEDAELDEIITVLTPTTLEPSQLSAPSRAIALVLQSNQEVKNCIVQSAGDDTVEKILRENRRPRSDEFRSIVGCFEPQRNVIPSILAPVAPDDIKSQPESKEVIIRSIANAKKRNQEDDTEKTTLVLTGVAKENTTVLLYVFSEPLVLATNSDSDGNWSYTLEDPIEPGEHEVYAMVDRGDGVYERSGLARFFIGSAEASEENPNGLSLELVTEPTITASNRSANLYIAATVGIVTFCGVLMASYFILVLKNHRQKNNPLIANQPITTNEDSSEYKKFVDGQ